MSPVQNKSNGSVSVVVSETNGAPASKGAPAQNGGGDQYSDGRAAKLWQLYIGEASERTNTYKSFLVKLLRDAKCKNVFDAACGTGVDSVMLLEEGFELVSADMSDKMLKTAYKTRWARRREPIFDRWVIEEGNWLTMENEITPPEGGFDALICMGNSFAHLPDEFGDQRQHYQAIRNFYSLIKPGGILVIDHRNYDYILDNGHAPKKNIYYNSKHIKDIKTSILHVNNKPDLITLDYTMDVPGLENADSNKFRLSYYPHRRTEFQNLLTSIFGKSAKHSVYADFKAIEEEPTPAFFIHVIQKPE